MTDYFYARKPDRPRIIELSDQAFGANYLKEEHFEEGHESFVVAIVKHRIVGFASCSVSKGVGNINSVVVESDYKRQGIGSELVHQCLLHLWNLGVRKVTSQGWQRKDNGMVGVRSPLLANGFKEIGYEENYYFSEGSDEVCIVCGVPCYCGAFLYELEMEDVVPPGKTTR